MSKADPELVAKRIARNVARREFLRDLDVAKADLAPAVLKRRVTAEAQRKAMAVTHQAIEIAGDSRGVIAATGAALVLWLVRKPIFAGATKVMTRYQARKTASGRARLLISDYWRKLKDYADE